MKKKLIQILMLSVIAVSVGSFVSCKDTNEDMYNDLQTQTAAALAENADLKQDLKAATDGDMQRRLAEAQLKSDYIELERKLQKIPPEIMFRYSGKTMTRKENAVD